LPDTDEGEERSSQEEEDFSEGENHRIMSHVMFDQSLTEA